MSGAKKFRSTPKIVNKSGLECTTSGLIRTAVTKLELISKRSAGVVCSQEFPDSVFFPFYLNWFTRKIEGQFVAALDRVKNVVLPC